MSAEFDTILSEDFNRLRWLIDHQARVCHSNDDDLYWVRMFPPGDEEAAEQNYTAAPTWRAAIDIARGYKPDSVPEALLLGWTEAQLIAHNAILRLAHHAAGLEEATDVVVREAKDAFAHGDLDDVAHRLRAAAKELRRLAIIYRQSQADTEKQYAADYPMS